MDKEWMVYINNKQTFLSDIEYLNYLLEKSHKAIKELNYTKIRFTKYDFEEIKEKDDLFYKIYKLQIDSEINSLKRFITNDIKLIKEWNI